MNLLALAYSVRIAHSDGRFVSRIRTVDSCRVFGRSIRIARSHANYLSHSYSAIHPLIDDLHGDLVYHFDFNFTL